MKIYCSGIGGIGLSAYAALRQAQGHTVLGSDRADSSLLDDLRGQGIGIFLQQDGSHVPADAELLVYSEAVPPDAPERRRAEELGIRQQSYFQALSDLCAGTNLIAVAGTHGKSSTTAMAARLLLEAKKDPTIVVGTKVPELQGRNWRRGSGNLFLVEACEYRRSFLSLAPRIILLTTCDGDHFDYYTSMEDYRAAFRAFIARLPGDGILITHMKDPECRMIAEESGRSVVDADAFALPVLATPGLHMQQNGQLVLGLASVLHIPEEEARRALAGYAGSWRRMEVKGTTANGVTVIDDYGHHPREVDATLTAIKGAYPGRRIVCAFQPHTHNRVLALYGDFTAAFKSADLLVLTDVYNARSDTEKGKVDVEKFVKDIAEKSVVAVHRGGSLAETEKFLRSDILKNGDVLVCMGAGTVTTLAERMSV